MHPVFGRARLRKKQLYLRGFSSVCRNLNWNLCNDQACRGLHNCNFCARNGLDDCDWAEGGRGRVDIRDGCFGGSCARDRGSNVFWNLCDDQASRGLDKSCLDSGNCFDDSNWAEGGRGRQDVGDDCFGGSCAGNSGLN